MADLTQKVNRIAENVANTYEVLSDLGAEMPAEANSDNLAGTAASISAVLYGRAQTLSEEQKEQARQNVGAAATGQGGGGSEEIFVATYGTTTCAELEAARQAGKVLFAFYNNAYMPMINTYGKNSFDFSCTKNGELLTVSCSYNNWSNYTEAFLPYSEYSEYEFDQYAYRLSDTVMASEWTPYHVSCLRNTKLVSSEQYPTNEGEIFWQYE